MSMNRAERRHRRWRKVAYAAKRLRQWGKGWHERAAFWADNMAKCDCWMCNRDAKHTKPEQHRVNPQTYWQELSDAQD
jgi:hypothetical protein